MQNAAARLIFNLGRREHVSALATSSLQNYLQTLHPDAQYSSRKSPRYLANIVQPTSSRVTRSSLRALSETSSYITPPLRTKFGERAFSFPGQTSWNSLPTDLHIGSDTSNFKKKLKTCLFKLAFDIQYTPLSISHTFFCFSVPQFYCNFVLFCTYVLT